jgi:hypothetical protein
MSEFAWPSAANFKPEVMTLRVYDNTQKSVESSFSGDVQTSSMPGARWGWDMDFGLQENSERAEVDAFVLRLNGREHRALIYDIKNPAPRGTINLTGVSVAAPAAQFASVLQLQGCGANKTLTPGDWFSVAGQLVMVVAPAAADGAGVMTVEFRHMLRSSVAAGAAIVLSKPTAKFIRTDAGMSMVRQLGLHSPGASYSFIEAFA